MHKRAASALILILICILSCNPRPGEKSAAIKTQQTPAAETKGLPQVILYPEEGQRFQATTLPEKSIIIFFGSDCDHCQREATEIKKNIAGFATWNLYFVSMDPFDVMNKFAETYRLNTEANVHFFRADGKSVFDSFGSISTPTICVYGKDKTLIRQFNGETKIDAILAVLKGH